MGTSGVPVVLPTVEGSAGSGAALMCAMCGSGGGGPVTKDRKDSLYVRGTDEILVGPPSPGDRPEPSRYRRSGG